LEEAMDLSQDRPILELDVRMENERFTTKLYKALPEVNLLLSSL
jgi:hypothetical protein